MYFIIWNGENCSRCKAEGSVEIGLDFRGAKAKQRCLVCGTSRTLEIVRKNDSWIVNLNPAPPSGSIYFYNSKADLYEFMTFNNRLSRHQIKKIHLILKKEYMDIDKSAITAWDYITKEMRNTLGESPSNIINSENKSKLIQMNDYYITLDDWLDEIISNKDYDKKMTQRYNEKVKAYQILEAESTRKIADLSALTNSIIKPEAKSEIGRYVCSVLRSAEVTHLDDFFANIYEIHKKHGGDISELKKAEDEWLENNIELRILVHQDENSSLPKTMNNFTNARKVHKNHSKNNNIFWKIARSICAKIIDK